MAATSEFFEFLDELRASGAVNMFGASLILEKTFGLDKKLADEIYGKWRKTFNEKQTPAERAAKANA